MKKWWRLIALIGFWALVISTIVRHCQAVRSSTLSDTVQAAPSTAFELRRERLSGPSNSPADRDSGTLSAQFYTTTLAIPTYPYTAYLTSVYTSTYNMTYSKLDWDDYNASHPTPLTRDYELLVLENEYLQVTLLPELGGRIYQMIFKPTGHNELYQNPVIKPTRWGPPEQGWWLAVGGIEWGLPVEEHGYEWGEPWDTQVVTSTTGVTVTLRDTTATDRIRAVVTVHLPADRGIVAITPRIENPTDHAIDYKYWTNGMLAPGASNTVGADLRFAFNADEMTVHSSGDFSAYDVLDWPVHNGIDYSRLGNWHRWLGIFERPTAQGDFAGVYDTGVDEGMVRVFPSDVARGSKGFGFGWSDPIPAASWTDDGSTYVELHGGVAPTFWDTATISVGPHLEWTEYWYPANGIGQLSAATAEAALGVSESGGMIHIGVHSTAPRAAGSSTLIAWERDTCTELGHWALPAVEPGSPFMTSLALPPSVPPGGGEALAQSPPVGDTLAQSPPVGDTRPHPPPLGNTLPQSPPVGGKKGGLDAVTFAYVDDGGNLLVAFNPRDCLPPTAWVEPLLPWMTTTDFTVSWAGQDTWSGIATYDVQVRDGYEGDWQDWRTETTATSDTFSGTHGHTYFFRARARDLAGNRGSESGNRGSESEGIYSDAEWGQTFTTVLTEPAPVLVTSRKYATPRQLDPGQTVTYTVVVSNTGNLAASAALTDTPPVGMVPLTETLAATAGLTPTYAGGQIRWDGTVETGTEVRVTYTLSPTAETLPGILLTNTAEIAGSVLGPFTRYETVVQARRLWLPLVLRGWWP